MRGVLWSEIQKVLSKEIKRKQLEPGDHIYTWRPANSESHHGIYVGDGKVIHFNPRLEGHSVLCTDLDKFLDGGKLYLFEYGVNPVLFLAKPLLRGTCTLITDTPEFVKLRASFFLENGFPVPYIYKNHSEVFAVYCKTGLLSLRVSTSEQAASILAITVAVFFLLLGLYYLSIFTPASPTVWAATAVVVYPTRKLASAIGARPDVIGKVPVEELAKVEVEELGFLPNLMAQIFLVFSIWVYLVFQVPESIMLFCWAIFQGNINFRSWVLSNKIRVEQLRRGDHIYTWRGYTYTHHGIYAGDGVVFHTVRGPGPLIHSSSSPFSSWIIHVESIDIYEFVCGAELYRYEYGVNVGYFIAKLRGGACTLASSDPTTDVLHRADFLLHYERVEDKKLEEFKKLEEVKVMVGAYDLLRNNCEDFAIYCKTGLAVKDFVQVGRSGQIVSLLAVAGFVISFNIAFLTSNLIRVAAGYFVYSNFRILSDTKYRWDTRNIPVEELADFEINFSFGSKRLLFRLVTIPFLLVPFILWGLWCNGLRYFGTTGTPPECLIYDDVKWIMASLSIWTVIF